MKKFRPSTRVSGPDLLAQQIGDMAYSRVTYAYAQAQGDSPIECLLSTALWSAVNITGTADFRALFIVPKGRSIDDFIDLAEKTVGVGYAIFLEQQVQFTGWRADFVASTPVPHKDGGYRFLKIVIECDGHDFHERTKEQAARDRARDRRSQREGMTIFRFTGSEIWNDPIRCANEVIQHLASGWSL